MNAIINYSTKLENDNLLQIFNFEKNKVRIVIDQKGEPWFIASDVAEILGYYKSSNATRILDDDEKVAHIVSTHGGPQKTIAVNESGLYSLIFASRKLEAKRFKKWVTSEVLPTIRKTGGYGKQVSIRNPQHLRLLLLESAERVIELENQQQANRPKIDFYDDFINAEGLYSLQNAARALDLKPNLFIDSLKDYYLFYQGRALVPYQRYRDQGLFVVKSNIADDNKAYYQTYITPKGLEHFAKYNRCQQANNDNAHYQSTINNNNIKGA